MNIYVGNLPFSTTEDDLKTLFGAHGQVDKVAIVIDKDSGRSRGFGFIEMSDEGGAAALEALNGADIDGRPLKVNEARQRESKSSGGGYGGGGGGGGRRY